MTEIKYVAKAVVLNERGEALLLRRSGTDPNRPLDSDLPSGGVDSGEEPAQAVLREITEEVGIVLGADKVTLIATETTHYDEPRNHVVLRFLYLVSVPNDIEVTLSYEHDAYEWLPLEAALAKIDHLVWGEVARRAQSHGVL